MTRYFANSAAWPRRVARPLTNGFDDESSACDQAVFLAVTYGGVARVTSLTDGEVTLLKSYSQHRGWHKEDRK